MSTNLQAMHLAMPIGSLEMYISRVNQMPLLSREEEYNLAERFFSQHDREAARLLVVSHLRYVVRIARTYKGYGLGLPDLIQEGNIGLMKAVKRFNPHIGVRLITFAVYWIKNEIQEFILKNWRIVKVATTKAQRKLFFKLRKAKQKLTWLNNDAVNEIAGKLTVKPETVREMESRLTARDICLDAPVEEEDNDILKRAPVSLADQRYDPAHLLEQYGSNNQQVNLKQAIAQLDQRSQAIIINRWLAEPAATLQELAVTYRVSVERIRQLEQKALKQLQQIMGHCDKKSIRR